MAYEIRVVRAAAEELGRQRREQERRQARQQEELTRRFPRLKEIGRELRQTASQAALSALKSGEDPGPRLAALKERSLDLQEERRALLLSAGYPEDAMEDTPICRKCGGRGWVGAEMCSCLKTLCAREQVKLLSSMLPLGNASFETFSLEEYGTEVWPGMGESPRENMEFVRDTAGDYARKFPRFPLKNLLFSGGTGLGKTFLSACIARTVAENGFSVVYDSAVHVFAAYEEEKFRRDPEAEESTKRYVQCDLMILDDLGSEMTTSMVQSSLYTLINDRLTAGKHTVISTNLGTQEIERRYSPQIASRLLGDYQTLLFFGQDIRTKDE